MQKLFLGFEFPLIFFTMHGSNNFLLINWREEKMYRMGLLLCVWSGFLVGVTRISRPGPLPFCLSTFFGAEREEEEASGNPSPISRLFPLICLAFGLRTFVPWLDGTRDGAFGFCCCCCCYLLVRVLWIGPSLMTLQIPFETFSFEKKRFQAAVESAVTQQGKSSRDPFAFFFLFIYW